MSLFNLRNLSPVTRAKILSSVQAATTEQSRPVRDKVISLLISDEDNPDHAARGIDLRRFSKSSAFKL